MNIHIFMTLNTVPEPLSLDTIGTIEPNPNCLDFRGFLRKLIIIRFAIKDSFWRQLTEFGPYVRGVLIFECPHFRGLTVFKFLLQHLESIHGLLNNKCTVLKT